MRDSGMRCTLFQPFRDLEGMPPEQRARAFERMERKFDVMEELGTDLILLCSNCSPLAVADRARLIDDLSELGERAAAARGMRVGYEALAWGRHTFDHRDAWSLVRDVESSGDRPDPRQLPLAGARDSEREHRRHPRRQAVLRADRRRAAARRWTTCAGAGTSATCPGRAICRSPSSPRRFTGIGYEGYWSLEIFNDRFRAGSASGVAVDGFRSLQLLHDQVAQRPRAPIKAAMPPRVNVRGVEFIEFAASDEEAQALGGMLSALGFTRTATHRRKAVTRWQQGDINIVINCEPEGFAHSYRRRARRVGLRARAARRRRRRRAGARRAPRDSALHAGSRPRRDADPVGQGVGGSLIYFIEDGAQATVWEHEFTHAVSSDARPRPLALAARRSHRADHAVRGVPLVAALLRGAVRRGEDAADRDRRHAGAGPEPGHRVARPRRCASR